MQLTKYLHALKIPYQVRPVGGTPVEQCAYLYLLIDKDIILIDSGVASGIPVLLAYLKKIKRRPEEIAAVFLTQACPDHIGGLADIKILSECVVACHPAAKPWVENINHQAAERPVPGFHEMVRMPVKVDRLLKDHETFSVAKGLTLEVLFTPGYTPHALSFRLKEDKVLLTGNALPLPGDLPVWDDHAAIVRSIGRIRRINDIRMMCFSSRKPAKGKEIGTTLEACLQYLTDTAEAVRATPRLPKTSNQDWARSVLAHMGLPDNTVHPLVFKTLQAYAEKKLAKTVSRKGK